MGDRGYDRFGPVEIPFPWRTYFLISFLAPIAITFLVGVVIAGFNRYFAEHHPADDTSGASSFGEEPDAGPGRVHQLYRLMKWVQRLPFLALLLLLGLGAVLFYKLDTFLLFVGNMGEGSVRLILISMAVLLGIVSLFALILIVLNYQLRKRAMDYQYKSTVADKFGLIILEDNTVLSSQGQLLVQGRKGQKMLPILPGEGGQAPDTGQSATEDTATPPHLGQAPELKVS